MPIPAIQAIIQGAPIRVEMKAPQGARGAAATIAAGTTTTLSPGSLATVVNVGTSSAAVFNFGIPRGATGATGATGAAGANGGSSTAWRYRAKTNATSGYPTNGHLLWNNAMQVNATEILVSHLDDEGSDIELFLSFFVEGQKLFIQNRDDSSQNQIWEITGTPTVTGANTSTAYYTFPVTLVSSQGAAFTNNHSILFGTITEATNSVTSATTSDGTANLDVASLRIYPNGSITYASTNSGGAVGLSGQLATDFRNVKLPNASGNLALVASTTGAITSADITDATSIPTLGKIVKYTDTTYPVISAYSFTAEKSVVIGQSNTEAGQLRLFDNGPAIQWYSESDTYGERSYSFIPTNITGERSFLLPNASGTFALTANTSGEPDKLTAGTISGVTTFNATAYTYGTGAAAAHRTALGLTTLATTTPGTNVANFLATPTSANLASALTDENGTGGGFVRAEGATLTTPTFTGSAARANGQNAVPATDDEIIVRQKSAKESFYSVGTVRNIVYPPSFGTSGTGSATAVTDAGSRLFSLNSGTANSGWARATLARGVSAAPNVTGTGINYNKKLGISIAFTTGKSNFTNTGNVTRIVFGTNQTATADGVDPLSALGFGIEFRANGSSHDIRVFGHNGTSMTYSSWVNSGCQSSVASAVHTLGVESDGAGNLFGFFAANSSRTLVTVSGTGGPTGTGTSANSYVDVQSCNSASSTTSQIVVGFDAKIFVE